MAVEYVFFMRHHKELTIFHIYRKDGTPLFLHPMGQPRFFLDLIQQYEEGQPLELKGKYGKEPRVESLTLFRNELYRLIEQNVKLWAGEQRFILRFLLSSGIFLVSYFILSVGVRDPIPMVDELLVSLAVALGLFLFMGRKVRSSDPAIKKRIQLREMVDRIVFEEDPFLMKVETHLQEREGQNQETLLDTFWAGENPFNADPLDGEVKELLNYLEERFDKKFVHNFDKSLARGKREKPSLHATAGRKMDLPLLATYARLKEHCLKK